MSGRLPTSLLDGAAALAGLGLNWLVQSSLLLVAGLSVAWLLRRRGPAAQSVVCRTTLVAVLVCPLITWGLTRSGVSGWSIPLPVAWSMPEVPEATAIADDELIPERDVGQVVRPAPTTAAETVDMSVADKLPEVPIAPAGGELTASPAAETAPGRHASPALEPPRRPAPVIHRFGLVASCVCLAWLVTAGVLGLRLVVTSRRLWRLRASAARAEPDTVGVCRQVASLMRVVPPEVKHSPYLQSPCLAGLRRPAVLLPEASLAMRLRDVLIHELAHLRRRDCHWKLLGRLSIAVCFFQPLLWILIRRLQTTAEEVCDDYVVQHGGDRRAYARGLVSIAELSSSSLAAAGVGIVSFRSMLARRIARIMDTSRSLSTRAGYLCLALVIVGGLLGTGVVGLVGVGPRRCVAQAEPTPKVAGAADTQDSPEPAKADPANQPAGPKELRTVSMSAEEFSRLSAEEQRALLVRVFQRRLEHAKNLYYDTEQVARSHHSLDGEPGKPLETSSGQRRRYRHWRLGDSFRIDTDTYRNRQDTEPWESRSMAADCEAGLGRDRTISKDKKIPTRGFVRYPFEPVSLDRYRCWITDKTGRSELHHVMEWGNFLFSYLLERKDEFEIEAPAAGDKVRLTLPWQSARAEKPGGKRVYLLDPRKGFLPIRYDARYDSPPESAHPRWQTEKLVVEESRLVGDVWMPIKLRETGFMSLFPDTVGVRETEVLRIEQGTVTRADLMVPFTEGMEVIDAIKGVRYVADAQGNPAGPVKLAPGWNSKPPEGCPKRKDGDPPVPGWSSRLSPADMEMLRMDKEEKESRRNRMETALDVLQSDPSAALAQRIEAGLVVLRIYKIGENEAIWAAAIRELIQIGKPAVAKLTEELDRTEREETLRALGFVLRGIGDPRSVPALIRAIPRMLQPSRSDHGVIVKNAPELQQFMQRYDNDKGDRGSWFGYGRPIREIMPALAKITGQRHGWMELNFVSLADGASRQRVQQQLYLKLARRWADWWSKHWQQYVENEADAQLDEIEQALDDYARSIPAAPAAARADFPTGPRVVVEGGSSNYYNPSFDQSPRNAFKDLDSGRGPRPSRKLMKQSPGLEPSDELLAWAKREGVDLINIRIKPPESDKLVYAFAPVGMKVWRIANDRYEHLEKELRETKRLELPEPWEGPLAQIDEKTGEYDAKLTVSFLFITKEGTCGAIQIQPPVSRKPVRYSACSTEGGLHYRFIYEAEAEE